MELKERQLPKQATQDIIEALRKGLVKIDMVFHVLAAMVLLIVGAFIFYFAVVQLLEPTREGLIHVINDVLLVLIILEILWTINRFLRKQRFTLGPFLAVGVIAVVRRILLIEAQTSSLMHVPSEKLYEMGLSAVVIIILMAAYYLAVKAERINRENGDA